MVISVPAYLPKSILFPTATPTARRVPSSWSFPGPTARTLPSCGFSLAVSGIMIPPTFSSVVSRRFTSTLSCRGRNFMADLLCPEQCDKYYVMYPTLTADQHGCRPHDRVPFTGTVRILPERDY